MRILAIDTALDLCAACVSAADADAPLSAESLPMARGHAEALLPLVERVIARVEGGFDGLDRIAVTVGPGSYTGLRVGLSAARAIGLATGRPVVGVGTLSALLAPLLSETVEGIIAAAIDARHGAVYVQALGQGDGLAPAHLPVAEAALRLGPGPVALTGSGAPMLAAALAARGVGARVVGLGAPAIADVAALGLLADPDQALPRPMYLRGPDARPQDHARLARR